MLTLNGKRFARHESGLVESLFHPGGTASGYYKRAGGSVKLFAPDDRLIAVITRHRVLARADKLESGEFWYSYGDPDIIGRYASYSQQCNEIEAALKSAL